MPFLNDLRKPFNAVTLVIAVLGIGISVYLYFHPHRDRSISFIQSDVSRIFDSHSSTPTLRLSDDSGAPITTDVFLVTFTIWNSGSEPIEPGDIRKPLVISVRKPSRIFDAAVVAEKEPAVSQIKTAFDPSVASMPSRTVALSWNHLDPKHGAKVQIILAAPEPPQFEVDCGILGIDGPRDEPTVAAQRAKWLAIATGVCLVFAAFAVLRYLRRSGRRFDLVDLSFNLVYGIAMICFVVYALAKYLRASPQF
jgi:hypothetical protein